MGAYERRKGANGERELFGLLRNLLGDDTIRRNLSQTRDAGADSHEQVAGWTIECKRWGKRAHLQAAIEQVEVAARQEHGMPIVMFRMDRGPWRALPCLNLQQFAFLVRTLTQEEMQELQDLQDQGER